MSADPTCHPDQLLVTARDAARRLAISERQLWQLTALKEIKCVRIGRSVRYSVDELRAFIARRQEGEE